MEGGKRVKEKDSRKKTEICACMYENVTHTHTQNYMNVFSQASRSYNQCKSKARTL